MFIKEKPSVEVDDVKVTDFSNENTPLAFIKRGVSASSLSKAEHQSSQP